MYIRVREGLGQAPTPLNPLWRRYGRCRSEIDEGAKVMAE